MKVNLVAKTNRFLKQLQTEGETAFSLGEDVDSCPHRKNTNSRHYWLMGWYDARTRHRLKELFDKWNITY